MGAGTATTLAHKAALRGRYKEQNAAQWAVIMTNFFGNPVAGDRLYSTRRNRVSDNICTTFRCFFGVSGNMCFGPSLRRNQQARGTAAGCIGISVLYCIRGR